MKIEKTTKIGELLEIAPEKAEILLNAGMHCLGCPASQEETIEEACMVHGIDVDEIIKALNAQNIKVNKKQNKYANIVAGNTPPREKILKNIKKYKKISKKD